MAALPLAAALSLGIAPVSAQEVDHSQRHQAMPTGKSPETRVDPHAGHDMPAPEDAPIDGHTQHADHHSDTQAPEAGGKPVDHAAMGHHLPPDPDLPATAPPREPIPVVTPADRIAAFPDVGGHTVHDTSVHSFWMLDRLETWDADPGTGLGWELESWTGTDLNRLWLRSEGERVDGTTESADLEVLYGRAVAPWWGVLAGVRHDFGGEGPSQTFAALGVTGMAPYKFEVDATAYLGESGQTAVALEVEYETLFTNRLILQWLAEAEAYGKTDPERGIGSGLSTLELGLRLRYEIRREFAPYVGVAWERAYGGTADYRREHSSDIEDTRIVAGVRIWF